MVNRIPKRAVKQADPRYNDIFTAIDSGTSEVSEEGSGSNEDFSQALADLTARLDAMAAENADLRRSNALYQQQPVAPIYVQAAEATDVPQMPDPMFDSEGYTQHVLNRVDNLVAAQLQDFQARQAAGSQDNEAYNQLWNEFLSVPGFDVWENEDDKVEFATIKVAKRVAARGGDVNRYMFGNTNQFFQDVAAELEAQFGWPEPEGEDGAGEEDYDPDVDRTGGLMSGQMAPIQRKTVPQGEMPDMLQDLAEIQRKSGFI